MSKRVGLGAGQMIVWTMQADTDVNLTLKAELTVGGISELKTGQSAQASVLGRDDAPDGQATAAGFVFTAPETGYYSFWSESSVNMYVSRYGSLWNIDSVDVENCLLHNTSEYGCLNSASYNINNGNFGISEYLSKGQTVYLKSTMYSPYQSGTFTVHVAEGSYAWYN